MAGLSPVQRTLAALRDEGRNAWIVEKFNAYAGEHGIRIDLFNIIDILYLDAINTCGVQCCGTDFKAHFTKLTEEKAENTLEWLRSPYRKLFIYSWRKVKLKRGGKAMRWQAKIREITFKDLGTPEIIDTPF